MIWSKRTLILMLGVTSLLLLIDICIRSWFGLHLEFDSSNFNNVGTPIITFLSAVAFLFLAFKQNATIAEQNRMILSQNQRPYFEKEIDRIIEKNESKIFTVEFMGTTHPRDETPNDFTPTNFKERIREVIRKCTHNSDFIEDIEKSKTKNSFKLDYMFGRSYYDMVTFLEQFTVGLGNRFEHDTIKNLIIEIEGSKLISEEQIQLKRRIKRELLQDYLSTIRWYSNPINPPIPVLGGSFGAQEYSFMKLSETSFNEHYEWFNEHLRNG